MKKIKINYDIFKAILDGCAHAVETDGSRPVLAYIQLTVTKHDITAYSLDGYRAARVRIAHENEDTFTCYFKPFPIKDAVKIGRITVEYDEAEKVVRITIPTNESKIEMLQLQQRKEREAALENRRGMVLLILCYGLFLQQRNAR